VGEVLSTFTDEKVSEAQVQNIIIREDEYILYEEIKKSNRNIG
jgi:hypothetical protein